MGPRSFFIFFFSFLLINPSNILAGPPDPYNIFDQLLNSENQPRILNTEDFQTYHSSFPQAFFSPTGDFNHDGMEDIAISGVYGLSDSAQPFFLLVAGGEKEKPGFKKLHYEEFENPVFLFEPGTTGPKDPGNQAFSLSFCIQCKKGLDYFWKSRKKRFSVKAWKPHDERQAHSKPPQNIDISPEVADKAILIASRLKKVRSFTKELKKRGGTLKVKIERPNPQRDTPQYWVLIFEKTPQENKLRHRILVDVEKEKVLKK